MSQVVRWRGDGTLESAWVRLPDGSWLGVEPRATQVATWGVSDRLWHARGVSAAPGPAHWPGDPVGVFEALDWARVDRIPTLAEPRRLPPNGGTAVLNLVAGLAAAQGVARLTYPGPYPTEQLFLALLESFRYAPGAGDPLATFMAGGLEWQPAPNERLFPAEGLYVQRRARVEKVVWRGRTYYRGDWQDVARHAPRRVRDAADGVRCGLWALDSPVEDHLLLDPAGDLRAVLVPAPEAEARGTVPAAVWTGVVTTVVAQSAPALGSFIAEAARPLALEWGPVSEDLLQFDGDRIRLSSRLRHLGAARLAAAARPTERAAIGLALVAEIAALVGDELRACAQAALAARPADEQAAALAADAAPPADAAARIVDAVGALVAALRP